MAPKTVSHSTRIMAMAIRMLRSPKNTGVHNPLNEICNAQKAIAMPLPSVIPARAPAVAMHTYRIIHVSGKIQSGGVHEGLFSERYHGPGGNRPPVAPAPRQAARKMQKRIQNMIVNSGGRALRSRRPSRIDASLPETPTLRTGCRCGAPGHLWPPHRRETVPLPKAWRKAQANAASSG